MTLLGAPHGFLEVEPHDPQDRRADREIVLLLHGLGGNKADWSFPTWRSFNYDHEQTPQDQHDNDHWSPPLAPWEYLPDVSLSDRKDIGCWTSTLLDLGHTVINYSQDGPQAPVEEALDQFEQRIVPFIRDDVLTGGLVGKRVVVMGHSRGGILIRYYLARHRNDASGWVRKVITLHSPHGGTNAPNTLRHLAEKAVVFGLFPPSLYLLGRLGGWFESSAGARQLLPGDPVFRELSQPADTPDIEFHTFGGTSVTYAGLYFWYWAPESYIPGFDIPPFDWTKSAEPIEPFTPLLDALPDLAVDAEQRQGEGDGLVTNESCKLPGAPHEDFPVNHAEALSDERLFARVADIVGTPLAGVARRACQVALIGNTRSLELHDPLRETRQCQLDEIIDRLPFKSMDEAAAAGYDGCFYCMRAHHHR